MGKPAVWRFSYANFLEREDETMSYGYNVLSNASSQVYGSNMGAKPPINHPQNCKCECPYGYDRAFCFPCYKKLMMDMASKKRG